MGGGGINLQFLKAKAVVRFKQTANEVSKAGRPRTLTKEYLGLIKWKGAKKAKTQRPLLFCTIFTN